MTTKETTGVRRKNFDKPGHFIGADDCKFYRHTHVGKFCVSTVGDYRPGSATAATNIGVGRLFETMVFNMRSRKARWREVDFDGYMTSADAARGHEAMVAKFAARAATPTDAGGGT